jgi:cation transport ATPase
MTTVQYTVDIEGMHCSSCALLIEKSLKSLPELEMVNVNFASSQALVKVNADFSPDRVIQTIQQLGYKASLVDDTHKVSEKDKRQKETKSWFRKFLLSLVLSIPMIVFMCYDFFP